MIWLDLDVESAPDTGTPSVEAHWGAVIPKSSDSSLSDGEPLREMRLVQRIVYRFDESWETRMSVSIPMPWHNRYECEKLL